MNDEIKDLSERIKQLGDKSTQLLTFLSFALAVAVLLWSSEVLTDRQKSLLVVAMRRWVLAIFPILLGILPVKEFRKNNLRWYSIVRWCKFVLLWVALFFIFWGVILFAWSIWHVKQA